MGNEDRGYTIEQRYDAPPDAVWRAWTEPRYFAEWFGADLPMTDMQMDVRPGGAWSGTMHLPDGSTKPWTGRFVEVDRPHRLVMSLSDQEELGDEFDLFTVEFEDVGREATRMTLRQSGGHLTDEQYEQAKAGTQTFLDRLGSAVLPEVLKMRDD